MHSGLGRALTRVLEGAVVWISFKVFEYGEEKDMPILLLHHNNLKNTLRWQTSDSSSRLTENILLDFPNEVFLLYRFKSLKYIKTHHQYHIFILLQLHKLLNENRWQFQWQKFILKKYT